MDLTQDLRVARKDPLFSPAQLDEELPMTDAAAATVINGRAAVRHILLGPDTKRMLMVFGPCSIHDPAAALEFAHRLQALRQEFLDRLEVVMRVYFEKPRTTLGWPGMLCDPHLDGTFDIAEGLRRARSLLLQINEMGLPCATELLDPQVVPYLSGLIAWGTIGARTTEAQTHRRMASGLSMPIGFKNGTSGDLAVALDTMQAARGAHAFLGIDKDGRIARIQTTGNPDCTLVLRGGHAGPNYCANHIEQACGLLRARGLSPVVVVDCSHANSGRQPEQQLPVCLHVVRQRLNGNRNIGGVMVECNLVGGRQDLGDPNLLRYGQSITDPCLGMDEGEQLLRETARLLRP